VNRVHRHPQRAAEAKVPLPEAAQGIKVESACSAWRKEGTGRRGIRGVELF
jgi:hypothetical protein